MRTIDWPFIRSQLPFLFAIMGAMFAALMCSGCGASAGSNPLPTITYTMEGRVLSVEVDVPYGASINGLTFQWDREVDTNDYSDNCTPMWREDGATGTTWAGYPNGRTYVVREPSGDTLRQGVYTFEVRFFKVAPMVVGFLILSKDL